MCELFAMSSRLPATVNLSLEEFSRHGGRTDRHKDGWGIAYYEERAVRLFKEAAAASDSECVRFIEDHSYASTLVVSHLRYATRGRVAYVNTHPFRRELGGREHAFAHNGLVDVQLVAPDAPRGGFRPLGETDSELAFCALLERLRELWLTPTELPALEARRVIVAEYASSLARTGPANFLYSDGDALFAFADRRRSGPDEPLRAPGLHVLTRRCATNDGAFDSRGLRISAGISDEHEQEVVLVASVPLTEEDWRPMAEGELLVARGGRVVG